MWRRHVSGDRSAGRSDRAGRVSSEKRAAASRRNGRASRGPRTAAGRAKASRNALHHGLNVPVLADPHASADARALATRIAGDGTDPVLQALALRVAEAQIDLCRVRHARRRLLNRNMDAPVTGGASGPAAHLLQLAFAVAQCGKELGVLDRYAMPCAFWRNEPERWRAKSGLAKRIRGSAEPKLAAAGPPSPFGLRLRERRLVPVEGVEPPCLLGDRF